MYWNRRAVFVHGIKVDPWRKQKANLLYEMARSKWPLDAPDARMALRCESCQTHRSYNEYSWDWARVPCPKRRWSEPAQTGRFCDVAPREHFACCNFPWFSPELEALVERMLRDEPPGHNLTWSALHRKMGAAAASPASNPSACAADPTCPKLDIPGGGHFHALLVELHMQVRGLALSPPLRAPFARPLRTLAHLRPSSPHVHVHVQGRILYSEAQKLEQGRRPSRRVKRLTVTLEAHAPPARYLDVGGVKVQM